MKRILAVAAVVMVLGACAPVPPSPIPPTGNDEFSRLATQVETEIRVTEKTGFLWRDTIQILSDARLAQREGRHEEAMRLARKALQQAQLARQQAAENAGAAPVYPKP